MAPEFSCVQVPTGVEESKDDFSSQKQQPWLLIRQNDHIQYSMFNNKPLHNCYYDVGGNIPEFVGRYTRCSFREWVLLTGSYGDGLPHGLVNLLTKETIELPLLDFKFDFCTLTSTPSDPICHIVFFNKNESSLIIWQPGDKEFTIKKWNYEIFPGGVAAIVAGKLFLHMCKEYDVVMVEFKESTYQFEVIQLVHLEINHSSVRVHYFFEYSGELFSVSRIQCGFYSSNSDGFMIFKVDLLNKKWVRIHDLGRLAIFIGYNSSMAHCAVIDSANDSGIAANSIYVLEHDNLHSYYVYNLEEGTIRMKPIFHSMETTGDTRLDWIMMQGDPSFPKLLKEDQEIIRQDSEKRKRTSRTARKKKKNKKDKVQESWNMVPPELLNLIQLRLFGRDHAVFRGVCKAWQQTSILDYSIPSLLSSATLLEQCQSSSPLLMYQEDRTSSYDSVPIFMFFDPVHRKLYHTRIPELKQADIQYSRDGWLLVLRSSDHSIFFFNPLTREKIELPRLPAHRLPPDVPAFTGFLSFSSPPTCSNCLVVGMDRHGYGMCTLKHGDDTWRNYNFHYSEANWEDLRELLYNNVVLLNGLHYFMYDNGGMAVLNLEKDVVGQFFPTKFRRSVYLRGEDFLMEIDGWPACVSVSPDGGISIIKWNDMEKDWESMGSDVEFGGKQMFLSRRCSFMEKIDDVGGIGKNIFLPIIDDAMDGVFYSLATYKYHTFYSGYSSKLPYDVDKFPDGIWVKPDRKIVGQNNLKWFI